MIYCKPKVVFSGFTPGLVRILVCVDVLAREFEESVMITSGSDGTHSNNPPSRHYSMEAIDLRSKNFTHERKVLFMARFQQLAGPKFTILLEDEGLPNEHFHLQVKKGLQYP